MWNMRSHCYEVGESRHRGRKRHTNEDSTIAHLLAGDEPRTGVYAVADGVGGSTHGEAASRIATETILKTFQDSSLNNSRPDYIRRMLLEAFHTANHKITTFGRMHPAYEGMSTTLVAAIVVDQRVYLANVGDSRAYVIADGRIKQVTKDHSFAQFLLEADVITAEQAKTHPRRHVLMQALGGDYGIQPDFYTFTLREGETLLLCSDGLSGELDDEDILRYTTEFKTAQQACERLIDEANAVGGRDNISVVMVRLPPATPDNVF